MRELYRPSTSLNTLYLLQRRLATIRRFPLVPVFAILGLFNILLLVHAAKTGRFSPWGWIILAMPGVGGAVYMLFELLPEFMGTYKGQKLRMQLDKAISPDKTYDALRDAMAIAPTIANREMLAAECLERSRFDEALVHYRVLKANDAFAEPKYWLGAARALQGLGEPAQGLNELDALKTRWPDFQSQSGHLLYARLLEEAGRLDAALGEYKSLAGYYPGAEPRVRQAELLRRLGRDREAREEAQEMLTLIRRAPAHVRSAQRDWMRRAEAILRDKA